MGTDLAGDLVVGRGRVLDGAPCAGPAHALFGRMGGPDGPSWHACRIVVDTFGAQEALPGVAR